MGGVRKRVNSLLCLYHPLIDFDQTDLLLLLRALITRTYEQTNTITNILARHERESESETHRTNCAQAQQSTKNLSPIHVARSEMMLCIENKHPPPHTAYTNFCK